MQQVATYGFGTSVALPYAQAVERVKAALVAEGFGVLSEIDMAATLEKKLGVQMPPYVILGACNPPLAHRALGEEPEIGLLLPCNVVVRAEGEDRSHVSALDPAAALSLAGNEALAPIAEEVKGRMQRVIASLAD